MYRIPEDNLGKLQDEIAGLNKRARKLGVDPIRLTVVEWESRTQPHPQHREVEITLKWAHVEIEGATPKLGGWTFAAKIEPTEAGNLVKLLPGVENVPQRFYTTDMGCDHCGFTRYRKEVFVVRHEGGEYKQIGRKCLADFLGGKSPEGLAQMAEWGCLVSDLLGGAERDGWSIRAEPTEPTPLFVAAVAAFARFEGYVSRKEAEGTFKTPTSQQAWRYLRPGDQYDRKWKEGLHEQGFDIEARDVELATKAVEWAKALEPRYDQNFLYNLKIASTLETVDRRSMGILAALVGSYMREVEQQEINRKKRETRKPSAWVGVVGQRQVFPNLTVTGHREFDGSFGVTTLINLMDSSGNVIKWWASGARPMWCEQGATVSLKGTVKKHDEYQGEQQTVITRAAAV